MAWILLSHKLAQSRIFALRVGNYGYIVGILNDWDRFWHTFCCLRLFESSQIEWLGLVSDSDVFCMFGAVIESPIDQAASFVLEGRFWFLQIDHKVLIHIYRSDGLRRCDSWFSLNCHVM